MGRLLNKIKEPNDIKRISPKLYPILAQEIRDFLIDHVSQTGGHLASNLGAVEITMALHICLHFPEDKVVYDVGHQSYVHKLLTGRKDEFTSLRQKDGLCGFPKRCESDCDVFGTGHSSTSISAALGLAVARDLEQKEETIAAVIGDGALSGGMAYEALTQLEEYLDYLRLYEDAENKVHTNEERGRMRKTASIRTFYKFFYRKQVIKNNTASLLNLPKKHEHTIVRLEIDEIAKLLDAVEEGDNLTKSQKKYHNKTKIRDLAILTLLLGTGIRVSECVGIDISNLDFETNGMKIHRKGGADVILYFGEEVREALLDYLEEREKIIPKEGSENALFLSMQKRRISVRAVENLVKKYARPVTPLKTITPHKLRSTYGTQLYQETGDIYLVADVLGHKDVNTTRKHYAAMEDQRRRMAAGKIQLREK